MLLRIALVLSSMIFISLLFSSGKYFVDSEGAMQPDSVLNTWKPASLRLLKARGIEKKFERLYEKKRFNGTVMVISEGHVMYQGAFGYSNFKSRDTLDMHSSFQLASVSKIFTATAIMLLEEEGKLCYDDKVADHLKGFPYKDLTIQHLLNHRSGMGRYMGVALQRWKKYKTPMSNKDVFRMYRRYKPEVYFRPNKSFNYCNTNYVFLANIVEEVSGQPFAKFMQQHIFEPVGMTDAMIYSRVEDPEVPNEALGYKGWGKYYRRAHNDYIDGVVGDKGMYASAHDLMMFNKALREGTLISQGNLMLAGTPGSPRRRHNYGFGWRLKVRKDHTLMYHTGWWRGFRTCYIFDQKNDLTLIVLGNWDTPGRNLKYWDLYDYLVDPDTW